MDLMVEVEQIKQLKARYFRYLDCKQWEQWGTCFTEDFTAVYQGPHPDAVFNSARELVEQNREMLANVPTVHQGHTSEIELTGDSTATGIWSMYDRVEFPEGGFEGWGYYHEEYRKENGEWKISRIHLSRLKIAPLSQNQ